MAGPYLDPNDNNVWNLVSYMQQCAETNMALDVITKLGAKLSIDGDQYCWLYGQMPECYIAGFGDTINRAALDFYNDYVNRKSNKQKAPVGAEA